MLLPFSVKLGCISIEISTPEKYDNKGKSQDELSLDIARCWEHVKEVVDRYMEDPSAGSQKSSFINERNPRMKLMMEVINGLNNLGVDEKTFIEELVKTDKFSEEEARVFIRGRTGKQNSRSIKRILYQ